MLRFYSEIHLFAAKNFPLKLTVIVPGNS